MAFLALTQPLPLQPSLFLCLGSSTWRCRWRVVDRRFDVLRSVGDCLSWATQTLCVLVHFQFSLTKVRQCQLLLEATRALAQGSWRRGRPSGVERHGTAHVGFVGPLLHQAGFAFQLMLFTLFFASPRICSIF